MVKINYADTGLTFDHLVDFAQDKTTFAAARYSDTSLRIFLVYNETRNVYSRNGRADSWEQLSESEAEIISRRISEARENKIPVYKVTGSHSN